MRRIRFLIWKELIELRAGSAPVRHRHHRADHPAVHAGYAATTDVRNVPIVVADARSVDGEPRADQPLRRVADLHASSASSTSPDEIDPYLERGRRLDGAVDSAPATATRSRPGGRETVQMVADGSDANSTGMSLGYATNLIAGYAQELAARARAASGGGRAAGAGASSRASASGSTRGSRAATS